MLAAEGRRTWATGLRPPGPQGALGEALRDPEALSRLWSCCVYPVCFARKQSLGGLTGNCSKGRGLGSGGGHAGPRALGGCQRGAVRGSLTSSKRRAAFWEKGCKTQAPPLGWNGSERSWTPKGEVWKEGVWRKGGGGLEVRRGNLRVGEVWG